MAAAKFRLVLFAHMDAAGRHLDTAGAARLDGDPVLTKHREQTTMDRIWENIGTIAAGVIGVAILAVLVSQKAQTPAVIGAAGSAFSNILSAATGPVTGSVAAP